MMLNTDMCLAYQYNTDHAACMAAGKFRSPKRCKYLEKHKIVNGKVVKDRRQFINAKTAKCCAFE